MNRGIIPGKILSLSIMIPRFLHFLMLFVYINIIAYEPGPVTASGDKYLFESDSLIEYFLNDILEIPANEELKEVDMVNENYRPGHAVSYIFSAVLFLLTFLFFKQTDKLIRSSHPFYRAKSFCLQAYYSYLFRLKPF